MSNFIKAIFTGMLLLPALFWCPKASGQRLALKTNTIEWVAMSPNLAVEARLSRRLSLQMSFAANPFSFKVLDTRLTNYRIEPELRYWFNRPMARHFMALSFTAGAFNLSHGERHFVGDALVLGNHWNMEAEVGVGVAHFSAFNYRGEEKPVSKNYSRMLPVPIRLGLSFAYIFK